MKIVTLILSFYILALNVLPCSDTSFPTNDSQMEIVLDGHTDHPEDGTSDLCSPFCTCHCCHAHTIDFGIPNFKPLTPEISLEPCIHFDNITKEYTHSLLQPPQV
ncbi:DUF6660 family protein [Allomuricauda sp. F6463D]|uniref:DUF6660 family protein n=1 Tax=Allomuricauda sp. F6463D TaxID=2926409 RepID=UPI00293F62E8|nr:DUF6660 family protein [Muricauda sp. F6463D]